MPVPTSGTLFGLETRGPLLPSVKRGPGVLKWHRPVLSAELAKFSRADRLSECSPFKGRSTQLELSRFGQRRSSAPSIAIRLEPSALTDKPAAFVRSSL